MLRLTYGPLAVGAVIAGFLYGSNLVRDAASALVAVTIGVAFVSSVVRKSAGVSGAQKEFDRRSERVAAMTGIDRATTRTATGREFHPILDLVPAMIGVVGLIAAGLAAASDGFLTDTLSVGRLLVGSLFLGAVTNAMLLGHWYLVQPGLPRKHLNELVDLLGKVWPFEVLVLLAPTGMVSVLQRLNRRWLGWRARMVLGDLRADNDRAGRCHQGCAERTSILCSDGGDRAALPRHSHCLWNRSRCAGRPRCSRFHIGGLSPS